MLCYYEKQKLCGYLTNILKKTKVRKEEFLDFLTEHEKYIGINTKKIAEATVDHTIKRKSNFLKYNIAYPIAKQYINDKFQKIKDKKYRKSKLGHNLDILADYFKLSVIEKEILGLYTRYHSDEIFENLIDACFERRDFDKKFHDIVAIVLNIPKGKIQKALRHDATLIKTGILRYDSRHEIEINSRFTYIYYHRLQNSDSVTKNILAQQPLKTALTLNDYQHINNKISKIIDIMQSSNTSINILLYGPPGTGKTELAKVMCDATNKQLLNVGVNMPDSEEPSRTDRIADLKLFQSVLSKHQSRDKQYCLLFDEAEDFFDRGGFFSAKTGSKAYMNDILDHNDAPTLWCTNNITQIDPAFLRRFDYILEMKRPTTSVMHKIWQKKLNKARIKLSDDDITILTKSYKPSPAVIDRAIKMATACKGNKYDFFHEYLGNIYKAQFQKRPPKINKNKVDFEPSLINSDISVLNLTNQLKSSKITRFSLCLYGVSGTGKSAYAQYLSQQLNMQPLLKKASDLISCYIGETEKNIALAFEEACDEEAILIIDEADSFLRERSMARNSWEVSHVNEMLVQMENHPYPFICTTNLFDSIDKASLRRFTFKIKYDYLKAHQVQQALQHFFNIEISLHHAKQLNATAPGDFANIYNKANILGVLNDKNALLDMVESETKAKNIANNIGFL